MHSLSSAYEAHAEAVRTKLRRLGIEGEDGEELLQEVFVVAAEKVGTIPLDETGSRRWLLAVARNLATNFNRLHRHTFEVVGFHEHIARAVAEPRCPEDAFVNLDLARRALSTLSEEERDLLLGSDVEHVHLETFGARLGMSRSGAHARLQKARAHLHASFTQLGGSERARRGKRGDAHFVHVDPCRPGPSTGRCGGR